MLLSARFALAEKVKTATLRRVKLRGGTREGQSRNRAGGRGSRRCTVCQLEVETVV